jgi:hypothetical protein
MLVMANQEQLKKTQAALEHHYGQQQPSLPAEDNDA